MPIGLTYAVWAAAGTALIAAIGIVAFGEPATTLKLAQPRPDHRRRRRPQPRRQPLMARSATPARGCSTPPPPSSAATARRRSRSTRSPRRPASPRAACSTTSPPSASCWTPCSRGWLEEFGAEIEAAGRAAGSPRLRPRLGHERLGRGRARRPSSGCSPRWSTSRRALERVRERYAAWQDELGRGRRPRAGHGGPAGRRRALARRTCSGSPRPRASSASRSWRACSRSPTAID